jgi:SOS-response transcriptional repressor LexA
MQEPLTDSQQKVYGFIVSQITGYCVPPTIREIAAHCGWSSTHAVTRCLQILERKGYTYRTKGHRNIRLRR